MQKKIEVKPDQNVKKQKKKKWRSDDDEKEEFN